MVRLLASRQSPSLVSARLENGEAAPIFLSFEESAGAVFVPYRLECLGKEGKVESLQQYHFVPSIKTLASGSTLEFDVSVPDGRNGCKVSVGYYTSERR